MHFAKKSLICKHCTLSCTNLWPLAFHHSVSTMCQSKLFIFCLLFALLARSIRKTRCWQQSTMCVQTSTVCVCVCVCASDKDWKAQRNVLIDFQLKPNEHNEQHTLLLHCMLAIFDTMTLNFFHQLKCWLIPSAAAQQRSCWVIWMFWVKDKASGQTDA